MPQADAERLQIAVLDEANEEVVRNRLEILEQQHAQHGRQHQGQGQGPGQRRGVGLRHRAEQGPRRTLQREQGNERAHHDERRKQQGTVDFARRAKNAGFQRQIGVLPAGQVTVDVLGNDDRRIDDDAEVHRADGEQIRRLAPQKERRKGKQQRQRNIDRHNQRGAHVAQEQEQDHRDQAHADQQVLGDGVGRDAGQLLPVVVGNDLDPRQHPPRRGVVEFLDLGFDVFQGRQGGLSLAQQHDAPHLVGIVVADLAEAEGMIRLETGFVAVVHLEMRHRPQAGLVTDDDSLLARPLAGRQPPSLDHVFDAHRLVVDGSDDQGADVANAAFLFAAKDSGGLHGIGHPQHLAHRVFPAAEQAHAAHGQRHVALIDIIAAHRGIAVGQRVLQLGQGDPVAPHAVGIGLHLVAADGPAPTGNVHHPRNGAELAFQHPVLQRLEIVERVDVAAGGVFGGPQPVAKNLSRRRLRGNLRRYARRQRRRGLQAIDRFLTRFFVLDAVIEEHLDVAQPEHGLACSSTSNPGIPARVTSSGMVT